MLGRLANHFDPTIALMVAVSLYNVRMVLELLKDVKLFLHVAVLPVKYFQSKGLFSLTTFFLLGFHVYFVDFCLKSLAQKFCGMVDW